MFLNLSRGLARVNQCPVLPLPFLSISAFNWKYSPSLGLSDAVHLYLNHFPPLFVYSFFSFQSKYYFVWENSPRGHIVS